MKRVLAIALCLILVFAMTACGDNGNNQSGMPNPLTFYNSLDEINDIAGTVLRLPDGWEVSNEAFATVETEDMMIAEYIFNYGGFEDWSFRSACVGAADISGVYIYGEPAFPSENAIDIEYNSDDEVKAARWMTMDGQFALSVTDNGEMDKDDFLEICQLMYDATNPGKSASEYAEFYESLAGEWNDVYSERAVLDIASNGDSMHFLVHWANSATEAIQWEMTVTLSEGDGLLYYYDCVKSEITWDDDGNDTYKVLSEDGEGFFAYSETLGTDHSELISWSGAEEEDCLECRFERG